MPNMSSYNVVVVGTAGSGKSCLVIRYIANRFVPEYDPTLEDSYRKFTNVDEKAVVIDIFDTAGVEDFASVRDSYIREGEGFIICYSITDQQSYDKVMDLHDHVLRCKDAKIGDLPFVVVGCKSDLEEDREVQTEKGQELARSLGDSKFIETSSLSGQNVDKVFVEMVKAIKAWREVTETTDQKEEKKKVTELKKQRKCMLL